MKFAPDEARAPPCVSREEIENRGEQGRGGVGRCSDWSVGNAVKLVSRRDSSPNFVGKRCELLDVGLELRAKIFYYIRCYFRIELENGARCEGIRILIEERNLGKGIW